MLSEILWPAAADLKVERIDVNEDHLNVTVCGTQTRAACPGCQQMSERRHGQYERHPADLPCGGYAIQLTLQVGRFFCDNDQCPRRTFAAQFPTILGSYARRTIRLRQHQQQVSFQVSAEAGAPLLHGMAMTTSPDTLIRLIRQAPESAVETPRVLGVDDWARRKGQTYGTILVDLEKHTVIDLLEDRSAETLSAWLEAHPGVEIISRDRGGDYSAGASQGAPEAVQIADRFHLGKNVVDALKRMVEKQATLLRQAAQQVAAAQQSAVEQTVAIAQAVEAPPTPADEVDDKPVSVRTLRFAEVKDLQHQGWSQRAIAIHLQLSRTTVRKYFALESCPPRPVVPQRTSSVVPFLAELAQRWQAGCHNIQQLHTDLQASGFAGHYMSVYRAVRRLLAEGQIVQPWIVPRVPIPYLSARQAAWLLIHPDPRLDDNQLQLRDKLLELSLDIRIARNLTQSFFQLLRHRQADDLDDWLDQAKQSGLAAFNHFARSLQRDYQAVKAALTYEWSNGQVEGQVNRLKLIKRQMYGRASFDLLRKRVLGPPALA